jgi:hypothetical protein
MGCEKSKFENVSQSQVKRTLDNEKEKVQGINIGGIINGCLFKKFIKFDIFFFF